MANILEFIINIQGKQNGVVQQVQRIQNKVDDTDRSVQKLNGRLFGLKSALMSLPGAEFFTNPIVAISEDGYKFQRPYRFSGERR